MIRIEGLRKCFRGRVAVEGLSFEVGRGEIFGLLGHNGAGKSTTFGMALGQLHADAGRVLIDGHDVALHRACALQRVGAIYEAPAFYDYLSGRRNLEFFVSLSGGVSRSRFEEVIGLVGLTARINDRVRTYSHGMRQRLALAQALLPDPALILLDEPTEGLDPEGIQEMREMIRLLRDRFGMTVVLSSHLLAEVEQLCDRVAILQQGRLVFCGDWKASAAARVTWRIAAGDGAEAVFNALGITPAGNGNFHLPATLDPAETIAALVNSGVRVAEFARVEPTLEDFYLEHRKP